MVGRVGHHPKAWAKMGMRLKNEFTLSTAPLIVLLNCKISYPCFVYTSLKLLITTFEESLQKVCMYRLMN